MRFRLALLMVCFLAIPNVKGQGLVLDGSTTVKIFIKSPVGQVPVSVETFHPFPAFDYSNVPDSISSKRNPVYVNCPVRSLQEGNLTFGDREIHLMLVPGDTVSIEFSNSSKDAKIVFNGKTKNVQNYYLRKSTQFPVSTLQQMMAAGANTANLSDFTVKADNLFMKEQRFWKSENDNNASSGQVNQQLPTWFVRYETDAIRYNNAMPRVYTISSQQMIRKAEIEVPKGYLEFLESIPLSNEKAMYDYAYQTFLLHYFVFKAKRAPGNSDHTQEFQLADQLLSEKVANFYKLNSISTSLTISPDQVLADLDRIKLPATSKYLVDYLRKMATKNVKILDTGDKAPNFYLEDKIDSLVSLSQFKGQVIYLSFWFAGCKGCVEEFPFENALVEKFQGKPFKVLNICTHTGKSKWLEMITKHHLRTVNLFANKAWENQLEKNYVVNSYPHYVLIGRDGHIIQNFAKRPREVSKDIEIALGN